MPRAEAAREGDRDHVEDGRARHEAEHRLRQTERDPRLERHAGQSSDASAAAPEDSTEESPARAVVRRRPLDAHGALAPRARGVPILAHEDVDAPLPALRHRVEYAVLAAEALDADPRPAHEPELEQVLRDRDRANARMQPVAPRAELRRAVRLPPQGVVGRRGDDELAPGRRERGARGAEQRDTEQERRGRRRAARLDHPPTPRASPRSRNLSEHPSAESPWTLSPGGGTAGRPNG